jgi:hypothetical protein
MSLPIWENGAPLCSFEAKNFVLLVLGRDGLSRNADELPESARGEAIVPCSICAGGSLPSPALLRAPSKSAAEPSSETKIAPALGSKKGRTGRRAGWGNSTRNGGRSRPSRIYVILRIVKSLDYWQFCVLSNQILSPRGNSAKDLMKNAYLVIPEGRHRGKPGLVSLSYNRGETQ